LARVVFEKPLELPKICQMELQFEISFGIILLKQILKTPQHGNQNVALIYVPRFDWDTFFPTAKFVNLVTLLLD
jgi:hypothetical protein